MKVKQNVNLHNRFDIEVKNIETGEVKEYVAHNIVLDQMWTRLCGGNAYFANIHFGTGLGTPAANRASLFAHLGTKTAVTEETIKAIPVSSWKRKIVLNPEEFVGSTITEVGIAFWETASSLVTHAMLKDSEGNVISITKTDTDVVTIFATVFITLANNVPELILEKPDNNTLINYLTGSGAPTGTFGLNSNVADPSRLGSTPSVTWVSDIPNKKRKTNISRFGTTVANGHVKMLDFTNLFSLRLPAVGIIAGQPYTNVNIGLGDGVNTNFDLVSRNIDVSTLALKVNGVLTSAYTLNNFNIPANISTIPSVPANGYSVSLSADGNTLAVGSSTTSPYLRVWDWTGTEWVMRAQPPSVPANGYSVSLSADGNTLAVGSSTTSPYLRVWDWSIINSHSITFDTPPPEGAVITADYTVDGIHKTDQYVVDVSFAIQFGEGV